MKDSEGGDGRGHWDGYVHNILDVCASESNGSAYGDGYVYCSDWYLDSVGEGFSYGAGVVDASTEAFDDIDIRAFIVDNVPH